MAETTPRLVAADMAARRLGELGWTQQQLADETKMSVEQVNRFLNGRNWPQVRNRAAISNALWGDPMRLDEIAKGQLFETQEQAEAMLGRLMLEKEALRRRVALLRQAAAERRQADVERMTAELDEILRGDVVLDKPIDLSGGSVRPLGRDDQRG